MFALTVEQIAANLNLKASGNLDALPSAVQIDSRMVSIGDFFVAIRGQKVNGADFIDEAVAAGAVAVAAPGNYEVPAHVGHIQIEDGIEFIQKLARLMRENFHGPVIAITGSQGKTSTKDLLTHLMRAEYQVVVTAENQNNELGLPLTLTRLNENTKVAILEMGMTGFHEIDFLAELARPTHGIITNIGVVHAELLGNQSGIARAKTEMLKYLPKDGTIAVREADREWLAPYLSECMATTFWTSPGTPCKWTPWACARNIVLGREQSSFNYCDDRGRNIPIRLPYAGRHFIENALLALAIATTLGVPSKIAIDALANATPLSKHRMEFVPLEQRLILNDCYNANPASMKATIQVLSGYAPRETVACLGNMYELGPYEKSEHEAVGMAVREAGINKLVTVGELGRLMAASAEEAGMDRKQIWMVEDNLAAAQILLEKTAEDAVILIKGSNSMQMYEIITNMKQ